MMNCLRERFKQRKRHASKVCKQKGWSELDKWIVEEGARRRPNILYIDKLEMIYCVIPKVITGHTLRYKGRASFL